MQKNDELSKKQLHNINIFAIIECRIMNTQKTMAALCWTINALIEQQKL